jgi:hypothetical protein
MRVDRKTRHCVSGTPGDVQGGNGASCSTIASDAKVYDTWEQIHAAEAWADVDSALSDTSMRCYMSLL